MVMKKYQRFVCNVLDAYLLQFVHVRGLLINFMVTLLLV